MSRALRIRPSVRSCAIALAGLFVAATPGRADIIKKEDMLRGITMTRAQCAAIANTVWVDASGRDLCVRYYLSTMGGEGPRPVVFIQGDYFGTLDPKSWSFPDTKDATDINTDDLMRMADGFSRLAKTTAIYLARIGVEGSSGNHTARKTVLELNMMNAALDAIKQRYGFEGFHLVGQSGGSKLVGGLLTVRRDIACAVAGSGPMMTPGSPKITDPGRSFFDVAQKVPQIAQNQSLRLMLVTDPADKRVPIAQQAGFVDKMRQAGRTIPEFMVEATDEEHHGVVVYSELVAAGCVLGKTDAEIAHAVGTIVKRSAEYNARRAREATLKPGATAALPAPWLPPTPTPVAGAGAAPGGSA
jgi:hypothetical protein